MHALNLLLVLLGALALPLVALALPAAVRHRPVRWSHVAGTGAVTVFLAADFLLTPVVYLLPRALPMLGPHPWTVGRVFAYLAVPVGGTDQWWVSAAWLLGHRPEPAWAAIQFFLLAVFGAFVPLAVRRATGGGPHDPVAALRSTHGSTRWRRSAELFQSLCRIRCDLDGGPSPDEDT